MKGRSPTFTQIPLDIVGSTKFGRYPKISVEQTFNMIVSDNFLVDFAGYLTVAGLVEQGIGRGIFTSTRYNHMIAVVNNGVFAIANDLSFTQVGVLNTFIGNVYIDENNTHQIAICDGQALYLFTYQGSSTPFQMVATGFAPAYVSYQNGRFIAPDPGNGTWRLSNVGDGTTWPNDSFHKGTFQTKPDVPIVTQRFPGRGNMLFVMGSNVTEIWQDIGANLFPYQRNSSVNIDYGCLNAATVAFNDNIIVWLAANEKSGPMIAYSTGGDIKKISTDGIDFQMTQLTNPSNSFGFLFRQDGHLIYVISFPDDNLSYAYDFNTNKFFTLTDEKMNTFIAKRVAFFNNEYYFVSYNNGNLYNLGTQFTDYDGSEIPRIRVCSTKRLPDGSRFVANNLTFIIEEGTQPNIFLNEDLLTESGQIIMTESGENIEVTLVQTIITYVPIQAEDLSILLTESGEELLIAIEDLRPVPIPQTVILTVSRDGGMSFSSGWSKQLNSQGNFRNRINYWQLGSMNEFTPQFKFQGFGRFVVYDGLLSIYQ